MICDCEFYEICPSCAPSSEAYEKAVNDRSEALRQVKPSSPSYTLKEIEALAREFCDEMAAGDANLIQTDVRLCLSLLITWLARREREGRG